MEKLEDTPRTIFSNRAEPSGGRWEIQSKRFFLDVLNSGAFAMLHSPSRVSALALALLGSSLLASSGAGAAEVAPTVSVGYTILNLYRSGLNAVDDTCPILSQAADGSFGCTTGRGYPLVGQWQRFEQNPHTFGSSKFNGSGTRSILTA